MSTSPRREGRLDITGKGREERWVPFAGRLGQDAGPRRHQLHPNRRVPGRQPRRPPVSDQDTLGSRDRGVPAHRLWAIAEVATLMGQVRLTGLEPATSTSGAWRSLRAELQAREG